jgi:hypothetical protein
MFLSTKRNMDRQYNGQKKHGQAIQLPKETWTGNTKTKRNMDRQYNDQKKHGQAIQRPTETWTGSLYCLSMFLLVVVLPVHVSFGRCIVCPCFFWSLYCLSMFLLVVVFFDNVSFDQKKHGQTIQRPKETWTDNTTAKRNMDRQYNYQKKHEQAIQRPKETWTVHVSFGRFIVCPFFLWSLYCLSMFPLVVVLPVHVSFGRCIVCPCFFWSLYCLSIFLLVVVTWTGNTTTKGSMDRQYNDQKKNGQAIQRPKETWVFVLPVHVSFGRCIACPCFLWSLYCLSLLPLVVVL